MLFEMEGEGDGNNRRGLEAAAIDRRVIMYAA